MTSSEAAAAIGVSTSTLRRWVREGVLPEYQGVWSTSALASARIIARLRGRGYTLAQIRSATREGRLAFGRMLELFETPSAMYTVAEAARAAQLDLDTAQRTAVAIGVTPGGMLDEVGAQVLAHVASGIATGMPAEAMLQLVRVYRHAVSQVADAEVRLMHLYIHEPLMRSGGPAEEIAARLAAVAEGLLPSAVPVLVRMHQRMLLEFVDQDVIGHMEVELAPPGHEVGRLRVAIAFADLAGYTELTERRGDQHALSVVERFRRMISQTLPHDARVIKTIGDGVMIVGSDPVALARWAARLDGLLAEGPRPRLAVHYGYAGYRDGDYYGREVNLVARVQDEASAGEVLATKAVVDAGDVPHELAARVQLRGFRHTTALYRVLADTPA